MPFKCGRCVIGDNNFLAMLALPRRPLTITIGADNRTGIVNEIDFILAVPHCRNRLGIET